MGRWRDMLIRVEEDKGWVWGAGFDGGWLYSGLKLLDVTAGMSGIWARLLEGL